MPIPRSVQEQADRAEALRLQIQEGKLPAEAPAAPPAPTPPAPPAPAVPDTPAPTPAPPAAPPASAPADPKAEDRYRVLQGKYNAEVPRLSSERDQAIRQAEEYKRQADELRKQLEAAPKLKLVTPEEVEQFGDGMVDMVRRAAREELSPEQARLAKLEAELAELRSGVSTSRQLGFLETLTRDHADWPEINKDPAFHVWLADVDPLSGYSRQQLLDAAQDKQDGARASAIFAAFKRARDSWTAESQSALSEQAVPGNAAAATAAPDNSTQGRIWMRKEVSDFYDAVRRRQYSAAEAQAIEAEIQRAIQEGRIR